MTWFRRRARAAAERDVADVDELWEDLLAWLTCDGDVAAEAGPGVIEIVQANGSQLWIHLTPEQWHEEVVRVEMGARRDRGIDAWGKGDGPGAAYFFLDETIASRWDGEHHVVFFKGQFRASTRPELPPERATPSE